MGKIIVVDDDESLSEIVSDRLEADGHVVAHCQTGSQLFDCIMRGRPDAIVLDHFMPGKTGLETLSQIKAHPLLAGIPVIMMTARRSQDDILAALRAGASDYMTKPFLPAELSARVAGLLALRGHSSVAPNNHSRMFIH